MKKIRILSALVLMALLVSSAFVFTEAEPVSTEAWQADLLKLMNPEDVPSTAVIHYENTYDAGVSVDTHEVACEVTVNSVTYGCEFDFELSGLKIDDWSEVQKWLGGIVTEAARTAGSDSEALAQAIDQAIGAARANASAGADGTLPIWANPGLRLKGLTVATPYYPELTIDKNGEATKRLQQKLVELGFLSGSADGFFGQKTQDAVKALEIYVRELEQDLIDALPPETAQPTQTASEAASQTPASTHELTLTPKQTPAPTATPEATQPAASDAPAAPRYAPVTPVDGVADALLQAYLYSERFQPARQPLASGESGSDVTRLQTRLLGLGYMTGTADGSYGGGTARAVRIFQYYNNLPQTGAADLETQSLLFSASAAAPAHPLLTVGSSGDEVKRLQTRLRELGFSNVPSDGDYGAMTQRAVETLQRYLQVREEAALTAQAASSGEAQADVSAQLTYEVNGIADPLLLDDFYSDSFPAIPSEMDSGAKGDDVIRVQRRLNGLEFFYGDLDGDYGARTKNAITAFQKRNSLSQTGTADAATLRVLFSGDALKALKPYVLKISTADQRVYAYGLDNNNEYTVLERTMKCSTGRDATPTPKGTFQSGTGPGARWHYFKKFNCWAQYAYYIDGDIMFHSVLYNQKDGPVTQSSVNNLGRKASHGCVRLSVEDAKWIYTNCPQNTQIIVY